MRPLKIAITIAVFVALGFTVERVKVSLNHYLDFGQKIAGFNEMPPAERELALKKAAPNIPYDYYYNHGKLPLYHNFSLRQLGAFKWGLAVGLVVLYFLLSRFFWGWMDGDPRVVNYLYRYTAVAVAIVGCFFVLSRMPLNPEAAYAVARKVLGFLHSPLPLLLAVFTMRMRTALI